MSDSCCATIGAQYDLTFWWKLSLAVRGPRQESLSESSNSDLQETELVRLQERASRLLQRSQQSLSSGSVPISSEGLGCSEFTSPVSSEEPIQRPILPILTPSTNVFEPSLCERVEFPTTLSSDWSGVRREDDILFQWRLRRKMEQARQLYQVAPPLVSTLHKTSAHTVGPNQTQSPLFHHKANLSFTPVASISLDPVIFESALPISSPSISRLKPDNIEEQPDPDIQTKPLRHLSSHIVTKNSEALSLQTQQCKSIGTQPNIPEPLAESHRPQKSSSPSPLSSVTTEESWLVCQEKKVATTRRTPENERREKKKALSNRRKKSERNVEQGCGSLNARRSRVHERAHYNKPQESHGESRWQEEGQKSNGAGRSGNQAPPPSPIHNALGQVVSKVLFAGADSPTPCKTPSSLDSQMYTPPPQSPAASCSRQQASEVIDQLMKDAEESDGHEFEDDPLLQLLRQQRKWVKEQLW
ncbi:hypothetical protein DNTS_026249 [Danionella cerebrum]|uniref:Uncharacterized protein n=1 Tax=Danionella cerebrum TaxID=2873325 RepID=A0A553QNL8_9TELE|nr:hypothetical protein DNTS_026249 [Danionella translucida]